MKLYLISQQVNNDYDTYDSAVVVAETEDDAKKIHPGGYGRIVTDINENFPTWCTLEDVKVAYIGEADEKLKAGSIICSSFNAG